MIKLSIFVHLSTYIFTHIYIFRYIFIYISYLSIKERILKIVEKYYLIGSCVFADSARFFLHCYVQLNYTRSLSIFPSIYPYFYFYLSIYLCLLSAYLSIYLQPAFRLLNLNLPDLWCWRFYRIIIILVKMQPIYLSIYLFL